MDGLCHGDCPWTLVNSEKLAWVHAHTHIYVKKKKKRMRALHTFMDVLLNKPCQAPLHDHSHVIKIEYTVHTAVNSKNTVFILCMKENWLHIQEQQLPLQGPWGCQLSHDPGLWLSSHTLKIFYLFCLSLFPLSLISFTLITCSFLNLWVYPSPSIK